MRHDWESKKAYRLKGCIGKLVYSSAVDMYMLRTGQDAREVPVDQDEARRIHVNEERIFTGRPPLFDEPSTARLVTLPDRHWTFVGEPWSLKLAEVIEEAITGEESTK